MLNLNKTPSKINFITVLILSTMLSFLSHAGLSINKFTNLKDVDDLNIVYGQINRESPLMVNGFLIYKDINNYLWLNPGSSQSAYKPSVNNNSIKVSGNLYQFESDVLFLNQSDNNRLWKFDGKQFSQLSEASLVRLSMFGSNKLNSKITGGNILVVIDGDNVFKYDISPLTLGNLEDYPRSASVCAFDNQDFVFNALQSQYGTSDYYFRQNGTQSKINFILENNVVVKPTFVVSNGNRCYYRYFDRSKDEAITFIVNQNGEVSRVENPAKGLYYDIVVFNGEALMFLVSNYPYISSQIYSITNSETVPTPYFLIQQPFLDIRSYWMTDKYLYIHSVAECFPTECSPTPPQPQKRVLVYDTSFKLVDVIDVNEIKEFEFEGIGSQDFLIGKNYIDEIFFLDEGQRGQSIKDSNVEILNYIGEEGEDYYFFGIDKNLSKSAIFKVSPQVSISRQINGLWHSDEWSAQGVSIHAGIRPDYSEYIFISFYVYRDGQPLWIVGSTEIDTGNSSVSLDLYEYRDRSFISNNPDIEPQQIQFGRVTLTPIDCNSMDAMIEPLETENVNLTLLRLYDVSFEQSCIDN